jgi:hypothetical protein
MEIKIQCDCGQRYKLEVEPVNGLMPGPVNCPACGLEGTQKGNELIQLALAHEPDATTPAEPPAPAKPRYSLSSAAPATEPAASAASPVRVRVSPGRHQPAADGQAAILNPRKPSFGMGLLGGLGGALVGAAIYYVILRCSGYEMNLLTRLLAIGVGGLAGWMAELLGKGEGSKELAGITAVLVVTCVVGAQYLVALGIWQDVTGAKVGASLYDKQVGQARQAVKMMPTGTDMEIRNYLAVAQAEDDDKPNPVAVTDEDIKQFRDKELPGLQDLATGKITREQFNAQNNIDPKKEAKQSEDEEGTFKGVFLLILLARSNIFSLIAAAALAFRLSANA